MFNMSKNMCQVCCLINELCGCSLDLTEPMLEPELVLMAVKNQTHLPVFIDHLCELKLEEREKLELLPIPKLSRQINLLYSEHDEPLICDHDMLAISTFEEPKIPEGYEVEDGEIYEDNETKNKEAAVNFISKYNI